MSLSTPISHSAVNFNGLAELRHSANKTNNDEQTLRQVAGQFEALFLNMMLKSMRQASLGDDILGSKQTETYRDIADQQLAMDLSSRGGLGLQDVIMRQLGGQLSGNGSELSPGQPYSIDTVSRRSALPIIEKPALLQQIEAEVPKVVEKAKSVINTITNFTSPESFVRQVSTMAKQAADKIGVAAEVIISQAALETGWGKHVISDSDGKSSFNLFNIKADSSWKGDTVSVGTLEYKDGMAVKEQAKFRSYESFQDSFNDYIDFLQTQPRYQNALKQVADPERFIEGLHDAGYATDPAYADKIKRILSSDTLASVNTQTSERYSS